MTWGPLIYESRLFGRDLEHFHKGEYVRGPIASAKFDQNGQLVIELEWAVTSFDFDPDPHLRDWANMGADRHFHLPRFTKDSPVNEVNCFGLLTLKLTTIERLVICAKGDNIRRPT